ncbi:hypothetical protein HPB47_012573 [Ixodes persulcatus]|uniref:Uncharacterized protein n=1 Tax=Ixodes persulcatus TaxID=34615 RepID=A0AC60NT74_IXOPE|nr:hypothetical protein HPB47_012573 [Ixodes persulcatus]
MGQLIKMGTAAWPPVGQASAAAETTRASRPGRPTAVGGRCNLAAAEIGQPEAPFPFALPALAAGQSNRFVLTTPSEQAETSKEKGATKGARMPGTRRTN